MESIPREVVDATLRAQLPFFGIACLTLLAGVSALLLWRLRSRDRLLLWVGVFSVLYATRLLIQNELVRAALNSPGDQFVPWVLAITYGINVPYALFARELLGQGWRRTLTIWLWLDVAFAAVAIPSAFLAHRHYWTYVLNGVLVVSGTIAVLLNVLLERKKASNPLAASFLWPLVTFGVFVVLQNNGLRPAGLDVEPVGFLVLLAGLASIAIRRALATERRLIDVEQELATARRIQNSIIPEKAPNLPRVTVAMRYQPMTSVAGDFFDFMTVGEHLLTILVADVSGHGVPAALVASMLKVCFAAQRERANNPAAILAGLNEMLRGSVGGQYVTAACAAVDMEARSITYAGAGHPPSFLFRTEGRSVLELSENGLFLGPFPGTSYSNVCVPLHSGDSLLLYTDGIVEAQALDGEEFGRERLQALLLNAVGKQPTESLDLLFQKISGSEQQDDWTAVLAHFE